MSNTKRPPTQVEEYLQRKKLEKSGSAAPAPKSAAPAPKSAAPAPTSRPKSAAPASAEGLFAKFRDKLPDSSAAPALVEQPRSAAPALVEQPRSAAPAQSQWQKLNRKENRMRNNQVRIENEELLKWVDQYAESVGLTRTDIVKAALLHFRNLRTPQVGNQTGNPTTDKSKT